MSDLIRTSMLAGRLVSSPDGVVNPRMVIAPLDTSRLGGDRYPILAVAGA